MTKKLFRIMLALTLVAAMSVTAFAARFTPSVVDKPAPEVVTQTDSQGNEVSAIIRDAAGNEVAGVSATDMVVTPVSDTGSLDPATKAKMDAAYNEIQSVGNLSELSADLNDVLREVDPDLTADDVVVRDMFDVTISGAAAEHLSQPGNSITIRFHLSGNVDSLAAVLHYTDGNTWETIPNARVIRIDENTVDVVFTSLSPIAFLFDAGALGVDPAAPPSPKTGDMASYAMAYVAAGVVAASAVAFAVKKKRS